MEYVNVRCLIPGTVVVYGIFSHNEYRFTPEISTLPVDIRDLPDILAKKEISGGCCGSPRKETQIFQTVD